jgi:hypothetical protein
MGGCAFAGDDTALKARGVLKDRGEAVVTVRLVMKEGFSFASGSEQDESKTETTGTVIGSDGLTVVSLSEADPSDLYNDLLDDFNSDGGGAPMVYQSEVSDVKIILASGKELQGTIALRDKDLDLAFIRPVEKPSEPLAYLDLASDATPELLDTVLVLDRLGRSTDWSLHAGIARLEAHITKPRSYYVLDRGGLGSPALTLEGKVVGIMLSRTVQSDEEYDSLSSSMAEGMVLPAAEIRAVAKQAGE